MSSVDFRAYCEARSREAERFARVYMGFEDDQTPFTEHLTIDHLDALLTGALTQNLRSLYMREYSEMRASMRATAESLMTRRDYYVHATAKMADEVTYLRNAVSFNESLGTYLQSVLPQENQDTFDALESTYIGRKNEVISRIQANSGLNGEGTPTPEEVVKNAMQGVPGVNNKGVALNTTRST